LRIARPPLASTSQRGSLARAGSSRGNLGSGSFLRKGFVPVSVRVARRASAGEPCRGAPRDRRRRKLRSRHAARRGGAQRARRSRRVRVGRAAGGCGGLRGGREGGKRFSLLREGASRPGGPGGA